MINANIVSALAQTRFQEVTALTINKWGTRSTFQQLSMWYLLSSITPCLHRTRPARHNRKHKKRIRTHYNSKCGPHWMRCGHGVIVDNRHHIESCWNATNPLWTNRLSCRARCVRCRCCASQIHKSQICFFKPHTSHFQPNAVSVLLACM